MTRKSVNIVMRAYDQYAPLIMGAVQAPGIDLTVDFRSPLRTEFGPDVPGGETSFNRYTASHALGNPTMVGLPAFVVRGFRHRSYIVHRSSPLRHLSELAGKRIGTNSWGDSGTLWSRAALGEAGVGVRDVQWVIGNLDENTKKKTKKAVDFEPPAGSEYLHDDRNLLGEMREGRIDAVTTAFMPDSVFQPDGEFRRLVSDFQSAEAEYRQRTGVFPASHIIAFDRDYAHANPDVVLAVYDGLQLSWKSWWQMQRMFAQTSPWAMVGVERIIRDFPEDLPPFGVDRPAMQRMLAAICAEQQAQELVPQAADPAALFAEFHAIAKAAGR